MAWHVLRVCSRAKGNVLGKGIGDWERARGIVFCVLKGVGYGKSGRAIGNKGKNTVMSCRMPENLPSSKLTSQEFLYQMHDVDT